MQGNHDENFFPAEEQSLPANLKRFGEEWCSYTREEDGKRLVISGLELTKENADYASHSLSLDLKDFNIVMLHGQEAEHRSRDRTEVIPLNHMRNKGIDYLALGHVHTYKKKRLDAWGTYCYAGCLEGRGFDECGEHGFVLLDIDLQQGICSSSFVPFAYRNLYAVPVDISDCMNTSEIMHCIEERLQLLSYDKRNLLQIVLQGMVDIECEKNLDYLVNWLKNEYYFVRVQDNSGIRVDYDSFASDVSLKGEFVRIVRQGKI